MMEREIGYYLIYDKTCSFVPFELKKCVESYLMFHANEQLFTAFLPSMMCVFLSWASFWIKLSIGSVTNNLLDPKWLSGGHFLSYLQSPCSCCFRNYNLFIHQNYGQGYFLVLHFKQNEEKKSTLRCALSLLFSHGEKTRHHAKRRIARWIFSLHSVYDH